MKQLLILSSLLIAILSISCKNHKTEVATKTDKNDTEILSLVFDTLVGNKEHWKFNFLPNRIPLIDDENYAENKIKQQKEIDSALTKWYSVQIIVFVNERSQIPSYLLNNFRYLSEKESFMHNFKSADSSYRQLLINLIEDTTSIQFDLSKIKTAYDYKLKYLSSRQKKEPNTFIIGNVTFSKIVYNKEKTVACLYSELVCGGECGYGNIYFLMKRESKWSISSYHNIWVS